MYPWIVLTQPINALAFVWEGVLLGAKGFGFSAIAMCLSVLPAVGCMFLGRVLGVPKIHCIWIGLTVLMAARGLAVFFPYMLRVGPFFGISK